MATINATTAHLELSVAQKYSAALRPIPMVILMLTHHVRRRV